VQNSGINPIVANQLTPDCKTTKVLQDQSAFALVSFGFI